MLVLLTGASGMLARALQVSTPPGVTLVSRSRVELDVADALQVERGVNELNPSVVLNCAAYTHVDLAETAVAMAERTNGLAPGILGAACAKAGAKVIHFSTDYVFDGTSATPYDEHDSFNPINAYGRSKLDGENALRASGARHLIIRTQWLFGPGGRNFPATMWLRACKGVTTRVVNDQTGSPTFTEDLARTTWNLLERDDVLHVVNEGSATWYDVAQRVFSLAGSSHLLSPCRSEDYPTAARRPSHSVLSTARLRTVNQALPPWTDAVDRYVGQLRATDATPS